MPTNLTEFRKSIYEYLHEQGITLTVTQHNELSKKLKAVYEHKTVIVNSDAPLKHELKCPTCLREELLVGRKFKNRKKTLKRIAEMGAAQKDKEAKSE